MNEVSIIINGVRYDAVDVPLKSMHCSYCDAYDCCRELEDDLLCAALDVLDKIFKKSYKKFEK